MYTTGLVVSGLILVCMHSKKVPKDGDKVKSEKSDKREGDAKEGSDAKRVKVES